MAFMAAWLICLFGVLVFFGDGAESQSCLRRAHVSRGRLTGHYRNHWDGHLRWQCPNGAVTGMYSIHDNHKEDRLFDFACSYIYDGGHRKRVSSCSWSVYSAFDAHVQYNCPPNKFLAGWESFHSNQKEDRRMRFMCCSNPRLIIRRCHATGFRNQYDKKVVYIAPTNYVITGVDTSKSNHHRDRRFAFTICEAYLF